MTNTPIRPAATVIVLRDFPHDTKVLMGQRGSKAAFMPNKFVFPGGAVDKTDAGIPFVRPISSVCQARLEERTDGTPVDSLVAAAIRELWEETGLILGTKSPWSSEPPLDWAGFAGLGYLPDASSMHYFFRAVTPPGRPRRFDARFFLIDADDVANDLDDFSAACEELSHLQWVSLSKARTLNLPFITAVVLAELSGLDQIGPPASIPFFENTDEESLFHRIGGPPS